MVNFLNPQPYLFWITVGGSIIITAYNQNIFSPLWFILGFYVCLIGSKIVMAVVTGKSRSFLTGKLYINIMRFMGLLLLILAFYLTLNGLKLLIPWNIMT